jgi:hypothetical protein
MATRDELMSMTRHSLEAAGRADEYAATNQRASNGRPAGSDAANHYAEQAESWRRHAVKSRKDAADFYRQAIDGLTADETKRLDETHGPASIGLTIEL